MLLRYVIRSELEPQFLQNSRQKWKVELGRFKRVRKKKMNEKNYLTKLQKKQSRNFWWHFQMNSKSYPKLFLSTSVINDIFIFISLIPLSFPLLETKIFPLHLSFASGVPLEIESSPPFFFLISIPGGILERYECCILSRLVYRMQNREMILIWRCVLSFLISFSEIRTKKINFFLCPEMKLRFYFLARWFTFPQNFHPSCT